ncbi:DMT family transporter [Acinetobacter indicus]|uniref:Guanidinium exporter n=1 Tax=Acinetobacter indicus CIP 110367 TaxID=1341679 RepID=V2UEA6_9GAMM|nr:multidrug efflux SMR transporter [Acinetobacter indicus]EPF73301.1 quaternary ammonium compound-resistance protein SugE [Acinetobacter indicus ANC 4215]ESK46830.1 hypothetical protein P253_02839 [Acinetobacter indicus CIP 110367]
MAWIVLLFAGILEIVWAYSMKLSEGFTKIIPTVLTLFFVMLSFALLSYSMRSLPLGTAYTIWAGIGVVGSFLVGIIILGESAHPVRILAAILILSGLILMKITTE